MSRPVETWDVQVEKDIVVLLLDDDIFELMPNMAEDIGVKLICAAQEFDGGED